MIAIKQLNGQKWGVWKEKIPRDERSRREPKSGTTLFWLSTYSKYDHTHGYCEDNKKDKILVAKSKSLLEIIQRGGK